MDVTERKPIGTECKHVIYGRSVDGSPDDILFVKERIHYNDGTTAPNTRIVRNFLRSFSVTREGNRNHKQKKEWERLDKVMKVNCIQREMTKKAMRALGMGSGIMGMKQVARSPYLYGTDISSACLLKQKYMKAYPNLNTDSTVAAYDLETAMENRGGIKIDEPILGAITFKDKIHLVIRREFFHLKGIMTDSEGERLIREAFQKYLGDLPVTDEWREKNPGKDKLDLIKERSLSLRIVFVDSPGQLCASCIATAHEWKPDFLIAWNMKFDLEKTVIALESEGYHLPDVFADPSVPEGYRFFDIRWGQAVKFTADGDRQSLASEEQWHSVIAPSSFYWIDAMAVYHRLRMAGGKQHSYALDFVLNKHLGLRKMHFSFADHIPANDKGQWHTFMQSTYPIEYAIYNIFDDVGLELLDEKTTDVSRLLSSQCGFSEYRHFASQTRRTWDDFHFFCEELGLIECATSDQMMDELDSKTTSLDGWIATLPSHLILEEDGVQLVEETPGVHSLARTEVADLDVTATYPTEQIAANISKETTTKELISIDGIDDKDRRAIGINFSGGSNNAIEICVALYKAPTPNQLLEAFQSELKKEAA